MFAAREPKDDSYCKMIAGGGRAMIYNNEPDAAELYEPRCSSARRTPRLGPCVGAWVKERRCLPSCLLE
jgi:hypothetical protein